MAIAAAAVSPQDQIAEVSGAKTVSAESISPYRGYAPYADKAEDRLLFSGREVEAEELATLVMSAPLVTLFSRSGLGKTSLICAAVLPKLRDAGYVPLLVRLTWVKAGTESEGNQSGQLSIDVGENFRLQVVEQLESLKKEGGIEVSYDPNAPALWSFFASLECTQSMTTKRKNSRRRKLLRPVVVIDQFEELFSRLTAEARQAFIVQFSNFAANRVPDEQRREAEKKLEEMTAQEEPESDQDEIPPSEERQRLERLAYNHMAHNAKLLIALREDYLPQLEELKEELPIIFQTTKRLLPMDRENATKAITEPATKVEFLGGKPFQFSEDAVEAMLKFLMVRKRGGKVLEGTTIEPMQLSILCHDLSQKRRGKAVIAKADLGGDHGMRKVISNYYFGVLARIPWLRAGWSGRRWRPFRNNWLLLNFPRQAARQLCEEELITPQGQRNSFADEFISRRFGVRRRDLRTMADHYLLRADPRLDAYFYELSHDSLIGALLRLKRGRAFRKILATVVAMSVALGIAWPVAVAEIYGERIMQLYFVQMAAREEENIHPEPTAIMSRVLRWMVPSTVPSANASGKEIEHANLRELNIGRLTMDGSKLTKLDISAATLSAASLRRARVVDVNFSGSRFQGEGLDLTEAILSGVDFSSTSMVSLRLPGAKLRSVRFSNVEFPSGSQLTMDGASFEDANFASAGLRSVSFEEVELSSDVVFRAADLSGTRFGNKSFGAKGTKVDFSDALLKVARFDSSEFEQVSFKGANLVGALFNKVKLGRADFSEAHLYDAIFENTDVGDVNLEGSSWWMAKGISRELAKSLRDRFPGAEFRRSRWYGDTLRRLESDLDRTQGGDKELRAIALNELAWWLVICGQDLVKVEQLAMQSVALMPKDSVEWANSVDTLAYVYMQQGQLSAAHVLYADILNPSRKMRTRGEWHYRYWALLRKLGLETEAANHFRRWQENYRPTHELMLLADFPLDRP